VLPRFSLVVASAALVALLVAGCGGSPSPQETWANSVCEPLVQWKDQISAIGDDVTSELKSPSTETRANITASVAKAEQATTTLVADLKAAGPPPGDHAAAANNVLDGLSKSLKQTSATVKTQADALQTTTSISQAITSLGQIGAEIAGAVAQTQSAVASLDAVASDLKDGIDKASSCKELRGS
jgi:hypothetical protein